MTELTMQETDLVAGSGFLRWVVMRLGGALMDFSFDAILSGDIDYAGVAEQSGTYYNMMGA